MVRRVVTTLEKKCEIIEVPFMQHNSKIRDAKNEVMDTLMSRECTEPCCTIGKRVFQQHRNVAVFGIHWRPGDTIMKEMGPHLRQLLELVNTTFGAHFNIVCVSLFKHGKHRRGEITSDEYMSDPVAGTVCISIGQVRNLMIRRTKGSVKSKATRKSISFKTKNAWAVQMKGKNFHKWYSHEYPEERKVMGSRVMFSFRNAEYTEEDMGVV